MAGRGLRLWSSLSGLVFVVFAVVGSLLLFDGPSDSSPTKMVSYYQSSSNRAHINIGWILLGLGLFALIWFVAALRERVRESEQASPERGTFLSTIVLVGGTVYIGGHFHCIDSDASFPRERASGPCGAASARSMPRS